MCPSRTRLAAADVRSGIGWGYTRSIATPPSPRPLAGADVTTLLEAARGGDEAAESELFRRLQGDLERLARAQLRADYRRDRLLDTVGLVGEAYLRLAQGGGLLAENRAHLLNLMARVMRHVVVDAARGRAAAKRGDALRVSWPAGYEPAVDEGAHPVDVLSLEDGLGALEKESPRLAKLVELRFFAGHELEEIAEVLEVSVRTVKRDWRKARAFLWTQLHGAGSAPDADLAKLIADEDADRGSGQ
jgi:RNA polymerase sigma factor (TIGR02999 family)